MHRRVDRLTGDQRVTTWRVWRQDAGGVDAFQCRAHPGVTLTLAELRAQPDPPGVGRILLRRGPPSEGDA